MKKLALLCAAMLAIAPIGAAADNETAKGETSEMTYQHPFQDDEESTKHWTVTSSGFYLGLGVHHNWKEINNSFEIGMLNVAAVNYRSLHGQELSLGVGIHHRSYSIKRPGMLERGLDNSIVTLGTYPSDNIDVIKKRSSNLNLWAIQFPLMFTQRIVKKLDITVAGIMNWNTGARVDNHYEIDKVEYDTRYKGLKYNKISFDLMAALSWNHTGIYCRYSPGKFFKDSYGPEIKQTWTLGLTMGM